MSQPLRRWQSEALAAVDAAARPGCTSMLVQACTGAGKSVLLRELTARARGPVLITTPTQALVEQLAETLGPDTGRFYQHAEEGDRRVVVCCQASLPRLLERGRRWGLWCADEAHRLTGADLPIPRSLALGLTATPFGASDKRRLRWDRHVYSYTAAQAVADGVLVPWRVVQPIRECDSNEWVREQVRDAVGPGAVSAVTIADAEAYAAELGPTAAAIHSRQSRTVRRELVQRLRDGELRCLVHVSLLTEGVDLPWLQWLALRRPVSSRVRVVQEVGRGLRCAPGKSECVLYDPHDVVRSVGLVHAAQIDDGTPEAEAPEAAAAESWEIPELEGSGLAELPRARAVQTIEQWIGDFRARLLDARWLEPRTPPGTRWRYDPATPGQRETIAKGQRWAGRLPERYRAPFRWLLDQEDLRKGTASDAIDVLSTLRRRWAAGGTHWMCPAEMVPPLA